MFDLGKPVIAAVNGLAMGGGFELALACDLMVVADHAEMALTEARLGLVADAGGMLRVPARLPRAVAVELLLTGRRHGRGRGGSLGAGQRRRAAAGPAADRARASRHGSARPHRCRSPPSSRCCARPRA